MSPSGPPECRIDPGWLGAPAFHGFDHMALAMNGVGGCLVVRRTGGAAVKPAGLTLECWARPEPEPWMERLTLWDLPMATHPRYLRMSLLARGAWELATDRSRIHARQSRPGYWQHLAVVCHRSGIVLYLNGKKATSLYTMPRLIIPGDLLIGARPSESGYADHFRGQLARMRLWSRVLEAKELRLAMAGRLPPEFGQLADWPMDEGFGLVAQNRAPDAQREPATSPFGAANFHCVGGWPDYVITRVG